MNCSNCNHLLHGNEDFCPNCGTKVKKNKKMSNKKKIFLIASSLSVLIIVVTSIFLLNNNHKNYSSRSSSESIVYSYSSGNVPKFIDGKFSDKVIKSSNDVLTALESIKDKIGFKDISKELSLESKETSADITYYKYNQIYNGIPILHQNIIVSVDKNNHILSYSGYYIPNINMETIPEKTEAEIEEIIKAYLGENPTILSNELNIWADYEEQQLVYHAFGYSDSKAVELIVDANAGDILSEVSVFDHATTYSYVGTGIGGVTHTINLEEYLDVLGGAKNRYRFYDRERNIAVADYRYIGPIFANLATLVPGTDPIVVDIVDNKIDMTWENESFIQSAITTMANYETIYDYYKNVLGRDSFDNKGSKIIINLGITESTFSGKDLNNAFWSGMTNQMYIGNWKGKSFSASLDVLGHEFTHGVISKTADFANVAKKEDKNKAFEAGALNEGYADILGSLIEGENWTIGENNEILRSASNPEAYKNPSIKGGKYYYPDSYLTNGKTLDQFLKDNDLESVIDYDKGGIHINSNVVSHAAYLMFEAGAFRSREEMAKVWYNSLFLLSSYSDFEDCALAVIKTAKELELSDAAIYKITKAFQDTKMLETKNFSVSGVINSGDELIDKVSIKVFSYSDDSEIVATTSNKQGEYKLELQSGVYKIEFIKDGFKKYEKIVVINGDATLNVTLASDKAKKETDVLKKACTTDKCYNFTIYFLEGDEKNKLHEKYETYAIDRGTILDANIMVNAVNDVLGSEFLTTDGKSFYMTMGGFTVEFAWYYKDTDTKFDWNQPINQDVEIEMKLFEGLFDNDLFIDINDWFY